MKKGKVCLDFSGLSDPDFLAISFLIAKNIAANSAIFVTPVPDIADVQNTAIAFQDALRDAENLGKYNVTLKNSIRQELEQMLFQLGMYVMCRANGDESILVLSGYKLVKPRSKVQLGDIGMVTLSSGTNKGELWAKFTKPKGTLGITFQITDEPPTDATAWKSEPAPTSKFLFKGLTSGKEYWVRAIVVGSGIQNAISPISTMFVL